MSRCWQFVCGLRGHDYLLHFGYRRMYLGCVSCGHESHGWTVTTDPPKIQGRGRREAVSVASEKFSVLR